MILGVDQLATPLCRQLGIRFPVVQAPIGSASTPQLVAAVAEAGGLGMLSLTWTPEAEVRQRLSETKALTANPFGVNLILDFPIRGKLAECLNFGVPIVSTFWGDPAHVVAQIHDHGALHVHSVGSADEAKRAVDAGVDVIVAQGWEAGGHVWGRVATLPLIPAVVDAVAPTPVIAAGGIGDGRGLAAVLVLGAQAGWLGTRFLASVEALAHDEYRQQVLAASGEDSVYTLCFDGGWPGAAHRALRNSTLTAWQQAGEPAKPDRPGEGDPLVIDSSEKRYLRYDDMMPLSGMQGELEAMAHYAGQSAGLISDVMSAGEIVDTLIKEASSAIADTARPS